MPKPYKHLSQNEREQLAHMHWEGKSLGEIAKALGRNKSTISRELVRNSAPEYKRYTPCRAHARSCERKTEANTHERMKNEFIRLYVRVGLSQGWSPEQISGRLRIDYPGQCINHEAIYQYIYHPENPRRLEMINLLRRAHKKRRTRGIGRKERKTKIPNRISIDARPRSVESRRRYGHWEGDSLISRKSKVALNTLTERKSRLVLITKIPRKGLRRRIRRSSSASKDFRKPADRPSRWTMEPRMPSMSSSRPSSASNVTSPTPMHHGNGAPTRT